MRYACCLEKIYHYIENPESITHKEFLIKNLDRIEAFLLRSAFYTDVGLVKLIPQTMEFVFTDYYYASQLVCSTDDEKQRIMNLSQVLRKVTRKIFPFISLKQKISCILYGYIPLEYIGFKRFLTKVHSFGKKSVDGQQ